MHFWLLHSFQHQSRFDILVAQYHTVPSDMREYHCLPVQCQHNGSTHHQTPLSSLLCDTKYTKSANEKGSVHFFDRTKELLLTNINCNKQFNYKNTTSFSLLLYLLCIIILMRLKCVYILDMYMCVSSPVVCTY